MSVREMDGLKELLAPERCALSGTIPLENNVVEGSG